MGGYRICVVGHIHTKPRAVAGNTFIPGWENWDMKTPSDAVDVIAKLADSGTFPEGDRYPKKVKT